MTGTIEKDQAALKALPKIASKSNIQHPTKIPVVLVLVLINISPENVC